MTKTASFDINKVRSDFPMLSQMEGENPFVYLDNAATTQKPHSVIDRMTQFYTEEYATVHRGVYSMSQRSTDMYEGVRGIVKSFIGAAKDSEIIYTKGTTEAINLVAAGYAKPHFKAGDEIIVSDIEHHANFVPWQQVAAQNDLVLKFIPVNEAGDLDMAAYEALLTDKTALVAIAHVSNVLGTVHPVEEIIQKAHQVGAKVLIDGAQSVAHMPVDMQKMDCDFYCFSAHKLYGPTGFGILYAKSELLARMEPFQFGGDMIESVTKESTTFTHAPHKFEAGTPAIAEAIGLGASIEYLNTLGMDAIEAYEADLLHYATEKMLGVDGLRMIGQAKNKAAVISFLIEEIHPHDIGTILDAEGFAIRAGHHCSQLTMQRYGVSATARASFSFYNTRDEIDRLVAALHSVKEIFS